MKILGRKPARYILGLRALPRFVVACCRSFDVFKNPLTVIGYYLLGRSPASRKIFLRDGHVLFLSEDPLDIVTVFLIFARRDYGEIAPGTTVVDIGANIGIFAVFAGLAGARTVYAFEPSAASFEYLVANIRANGLDGVVIPDRRAVVGRPRANIKFPKSSSVLNAILPDSTQGDAFDVVPAVTLGEIAADQRSIDLLKLDCEGGEYEILFDSPVPDVRRSAEIRMECHKGPREQLIACLTAMGFVIRQSTDEGEGVGYLRLVRST
jgi:FkbM family methyltransferase